jgi:hypothetical protein
VLFLTRSYFLSLFPFFNFSFCEDTVVDGIRLPFFRNNILLDITTSYFYYFVISMRTIPDWLLRRIALFPYAEVAPRTDEMILEVCVARGPWASVEVVPAMHWADDRLAEYVQTLRPSNRPRLLVIDRAQPRMRDQMAGAGLSWAERTTGVLHLQLPSYFVHDTVSPHAYGAAGTPNAERSGARPTRLVGKSGRCAESLLLWVAAPKTSVEFTPTMLSAMANVSVQLATKVLHRLEKEEAVIGRKRGALTDAWRVSQPSRILDLWAAEERRPATITRAYVWARSPRELLAKLANLDSLRGKYAVGGVTAANIYAPTLTVDPAPAVWIESAVPVAHVLKALEGEEVSEGANVEFRQATADPALWHRIVAGNNRSTQAPAGEDQGASTMQPEPSGTPSDWQAFLRPLAEHLPPLRQLPNLALVSRVRAYVEALHEGGRAPEVAEALRSTLALHISDA